MRAVVVPAKRSVDIDSEIDLHLANLLVDDAEHTG